jgi:Fe-S cluster biosynthesis and repair protein YggX
MICVRCGREAESMAEPPLGGAVGREVQTQVCEECWNEWKAQSTMVINHYGLQLHNAADRAQLLQAMREFLGLREA